MNKVLFYGSLRKGEYNYNYFLRIFGEDNFKYIKTKTIKGFKLYSLGAYPMVIQTNDINDKLVVDEFEVSDEAYSSINSMELGAGYDISKFEGATIYTYPLNEMKYYTDSIVKSGDWSEYLKSLNQLTISQ